jgi:general secretion pathway protein G
MMKNTNKKMHRRNGSKGFTLIELMVVLVILGLLAGLVGTKVIRYIAKAKVTTAKAQISMLDKGVKQFKIDTGVYPESIEDLVQEPPDVTGWDPEGYLDNPAIPKDPWGNEYYYEYPGNRSTTFDIYSLGADGKEGGETEEDKDIYNSEISEEEEQI